jgi:hypothetical protein
LVVRPSSNSTVVTVHNGVKDKIEHFAEAIWEDGDHVNERGFVLPRRGSVLIGYKTLSNKSECSATGRLDWTGTEVGITTSWVFVTIADGVGGGSRGGFSQVGRVDIWVEVDTTGFGVVVHG